MADETESEKERRLLFVLLGAQSRIGWLIDDLLERRVTDVDYWLAEGRIELHWTPQEVDESPRRAATNG